MATTPSAPQILGSRIREARKAAAMQLTKLAAECQVSVDTLERWEAGEYPGPRFWQVCVISDLTGKPLDWFTTDPAAEAVA